MANSNPELAKHDESKTSIVKKREQNPQRKKGYSEESRLIFQEENLLQETNNSYSWSQ